MRKKVKKHFCANRFLTSLLKLTKGLVECNEKTITKTGKQLTCKSTSVDEGLHVKSVNASIGFEPLSWWSSMARTDTEFD